MDGWKKEEKEGGRASGRKSEIGKKKEELRTKWREREGKGREDGCLEEKMEK